MRHLINDLPTPAVVAPQAMELAGGQSRGGNFWDHAALATQHAVPDLGSGAINDNGHAALDTAALDHGHSQFDSMHLQTSTSDHDRELSQVASIEQTEQSSTRSVAHHVGDGGTDGQSHNGAPPSDSGAVVSDQAGHLAGDADAGSAHDAATVTAGDATVYPILGSMEGGDIMALAFLVMMEAAKSAQDDLKSIMDGVEEINKQKEMLDSTLNAENKLTAAPDTHSDSTSPHYEVATTSDSSHHWPF